MNKLLSSLALAGIAGTAFAAGNVDGLTVKAKVDFESEYIFRGKEHSDKNTQTKVIAEYALPDVEAAIYAGVFMMSPIDQVANETISFVGARTEYEKFMFDASYSHYGYPNRNSNPAYGATQGGEYIPSTNGYHYSDSNEISFGVATSAFKEVFTPSAYIHYNFDLKQTTYEAALRRSFSGDELGLTGVELIVAGFAGYVQADRANGDQIANGIVSYENDYGYIGASVDVAYAVSNSAKVGAGVRWAWNSDGNEDYRNYANTDENFWYGLWAEFKY